MRSTITQFKGEVKSGIITALKQKKSNIAKHCRENWHESEQNVRQKIKHHRIDEEWLNSFLKTIHPKLKIYQHTEVAIFFLEE